MPIRVELADGTPLEFEDGTPDAVIDRVVKQHISGALDEEAGPPVTASEAAPETAPADINKPNPAFEQAVAGLLSRAAAEDTFDPQALQSLAQKYGYPGVSNLADIESFYKKSGRLNPKVTYGIMAPVGETTPAKPEDIISEMPPASEGVNRARAFGKGLLFDFADEAEAATRMLSEGKISPDEYYRIKSQINADYNDWAKKNTGEALGLELSGGVAGAFIPGFGQLGTGMRGARAALRAGETLASPLLSAAKAGARSGALSGALSGLGQSETLAPSDVLPSVLSGATIGGVTGGVLGPSAEMLGRRLGGGRSAADAVDRRVADILYSSTPSPARAAGATALAQKYDVPTPYGLSTPELTALTEKVLAKPSAGQPALAEQLVRRQAVATPRVQEQVRRALPGTEDYFTAEDAITSNLRKIGENEYQRAFAVGPVNDRELIDLANNPELSSVWAKAQRLARLEGRDLPVKMEPVLDEGGALVGLRPTSQTIPDVQSLDYLKRALDDTIDAGFRGNAGVGKAEANVLKERIRGPLVRRLDELVPEYREARALYAGDLEVRDALRLGRDILKNKMRPQQLEREINGIPGRQAPMSEGEREALKTGARQAIFEPLEDVTSNRNFAQRIRGIRGDNSALQKLKMVIDPAEYKFFERALRREDELFARGSKVLGGSRTTPLAQGVAALDDLIGNGKTTEAVNFILASNPGRIATLARWVSNLQPGKEFGDKVYTRLSQVLSAENPDQLRGILDMLAKSRSFSQHMARVRGAIAPIAGVGGNVAPSVFEPRTSEMPPAVAFTDPNAESPEESIRRAKAAISTPLPGGDETLPTPSGAPSAAMDIGEQGSYNPATGIVTMQDGTEIQVDR